MEVLIENFRGIERVQIVMAPIALLFGKSHQGKSSICQCVGAALTGRAGPFIRAARNADEFAVLPTKTALNGRGRDGVGSGSVTIKAEAGATTLGLPNCEVTSTGNAPKSSVYAAGMVKVMALKPMDRFELLMNLLSVMLVGDEIGAESSGTSTIMANAANLEILAPDGSRHSMPANRLQLLNNAVLQSVTGAAGYQPVSIDENLQLRFGGRHYDLLSEPEKFRVDVVLQIAIALVDKSSCVIIDGADILDTDGRNGLFAALASAGTSLLSLVGLTAAGEMGIPNLAKHGMGVTYRVVDGACTTMD